LVQFIPARGAQMKTGNIRELQPDILAGVKYTRHMIVQ
jgi:hypothetical protein